MKVFHFILVSLFFILISYSKGQNAPILVGTPSVKAKTAALSRPCHRVFTKGRPVVQTWSLTDLWELSDKELRRLRPHHLILLKPYPAQYLVNYYYKGGIDFTNAQKLALGMTDALSTKADPHISRRLLSDKEFKKGWDLDYLTVNVIQDLTGKTIAAANDRSAAQDAFASALTAFRKAYFLASGERGRNGYLAMEDNFTDAQLKEKVHILKKHFSKEDILLLIRDQHLTENMVD